MANPENISIAVGIALLASLAGEIYTFHGCRPQSWIFHFQFPPSLVVRYGRPRIHWYICWNRVNAIKCGNGNNRFAVSTSGLRPPSWIFHFRSFKKVFRRIGLSSRSPNLIKMSHGWYETHVLRSLKFDFLIKIVFLVFKKIHISIKCCNFLIVKNLNIFHVLRFVHDLHRCSGSQDILCWIWGYFSPPVYNERL